MPRPLDSDSCAVCIENAGDMPPNHRCRMSCRCGHEKCINLGADDFRTHLQFMYDKAQRTDHELMIYALNRMLAPWRDGVKKGRGLPAEKRESRNTRGKAAVSGLCMKPVGMKKCLRDRNHEGPCKP